MTTSSSMTNDQPGLQLNGSMMPPSSTAANPSIFGTDGIRGHVGNFLTAPLALQVGFGAGQVLKNHFPKAPVIIGQDSRSSSPMLVMALSAGFTAAGLEVWDLGLCPTAAVAYLTHQLGAIAGVMVSASHNPPEDNGIKFFEPTGAKLSPQLQSQITAIIGDVNQSSTPIPATWGKCHSRSELIQRYISSLHQPLFPEMGTDGLPLQGMRIVLDLAWGAAAQLGERVFGTTGATLIQLHNRPDGERINVACGSTYLKPLQTAVQIHQADMGFAFDGDADRVLAVDGQGRVIDGDYILYLWGQTLKQMGLLPDNTIVSSVMANLGFEVAWMGQGGRLIRTGVGDQYVHSEMVRLGAMLGGEQSGHILCRHYSVSGDGLLTALHLATLVKKSGVSMDHLFDHSFQTYPQLLRNVRIEDRQRRLNWQDCDALVTAIAHAQQDLGEQGRVLVRASGTEPLLRIMVEAIHPDLAHHWTDTLVRVAEGQLVTSPQSN